MTLRTTSIRRQRQAWAYLALLGIVAYFVLVPVLGLGNPFRFFGPHQMRVLLPLVILLRILAREFRWDGVVREEKVEVEGRGGDEVEKVGGGGQRKVASDSAGQPTGDGRARTPTAPQSSGNAVSLGNDCGAPGGRPLPQRDESGATRPVLCQPQPFPSTSSQPPSTISPAAELWSRAQAMESELDPVLPIEACESYMTLVYGAAEGGHVAAQARLGELAFNRGAFVEAYFWTKMARRRLELEDSSAEQGLKEIDGMLRNIRREWAAAGQPLEFENVYDSFPEERGELGRAFLRIDGGVEVQQTREYIRVLADKGNPDAMLFVS